MRDRGFSLLELLISLTLMGVAAAAIGSVFVNGLRVYSRQIELLRIRADLRLAMATFTRELRVLDAGDLLGGDVAEMDRSSITYRAARSTYFLCSPPDVDAFTLTVWQQPQAALREIDPGRDSLLLFAENETATTADDVWLPAAPSSVTSGDFCPGGQPGLRIVVRGVSRDELQGLRRGAVVRGYQMTRLLLYDDSERRSWVGLREWRPGSGWSITQPIIGPVARDGLRFDYFTSGGGPATTPSEIASIAVKVVAVGAGSARLVCDSLLIHVGLRNNPRRF